MWATIYQLIQNKLESNVTFIGEIVIKKGILSVPIPINFTYKLKEFM